MNDKIKPQTTSTFKNDILTEGTGSINEPAINNIDQAKQVNDLLNVLTELPKYKNELKNFENKVQDLEKSINQQKINFIEIIGVFVGIFTFISVEIQILKYANSILSIAGLSLIFYSGLLLFLYTIYYYVHKIKLNHLKLTLREKWIFGICIGMATLGIVFVWAGDYRNPAVVKNSPDFLELDNMNRILEQRIIMLENDVSLPGKNF